MKKSKVCIFVDRRYAAAKLDKKVQQDYVQINAFRKQNERVKTKTCKLRDLNVTIKMKGEKIEKSVL